MFYRERGTTFTDFDLDRIIGNVNTESISHTISLFALVPQNFVIWANASINKRFVLPRQVNILHRYFSKVFLDTPSLLTILPFGKFYNYCWTFFLILWQASIGYGGISKPSLLKKLRTFFFKTSTSTSLGMSNVFRHPLLPNTDVAYRSICLIKVNLLPAKQLIQTEVWRKH